MLVVFYFCDQCHNGHRRRDNRSNDRLRESRFLGNDFGDGRLGNNLGHHFFDESFHQYERLFRNHFLSDWSFRNGFFCDWLLRNHFFSRCFFDRCLDYFFHNGFFSDRLLGDHFFSRCLLHDFFGDCFFGRRFLGSCFFRCSLGDNLFRNDFLSDWFFRSRFFRGGFCFICFHLRLPIYENGLILVFVQRISAAASAWRYSTRFCAPSMKSTSHSPPDFQAAHWAPSATTETLRARAKLLRTIRHFFDANEVMEVETPALSKHATVDKHIDSFQTHDGAWLHTSPEFPMKRLLCAGSGAIWQLCKVFRFEEAGRQHNPEFTLLEWYRPGYDHHRLMDEMEQLLRHCGVPGVKPFDRLSYCDAFLQHVGFNPLQASVAEMQSAAQHYSPPPPENLLSRDDWLDYFFGCIVSPALGRQQPCFVYNFPASQAALSRVCGDVAERFELIWRGVELANGFHELADAAEQSRRFEADLAWRREQGKHTPPADTNLIAALQAGLPDCAGVALGIDRLLMLLIDAPNLAATLAFDWSRA